MDVSCVYNYYIYGMLIALILIFLFATNYTKRIFFLEFASAVFYFHFLILNIFVLLLYNMCEYGHTHAMTRVDIKGQVLKVNFFFHWGFWDQTQVIRLTQ